MTNAGPVSSYCDKSLNLPFVRDKDRNKAYGRLVYFSAQRDTMEQINKVSACLSEIYFSVIVYNISSYICFKQRVSFRYKLAAKAQA